MYSETLKLLGTSTTVSSLPSTLEILIRTRKQEWFRNRDGSSSLYQDCTPTLHYSFPFPLNIFSDPLACKILFSTAVSKAAPDLQNSSCLSLALDISKFAFTCARDLVGHRGHPGISVVADIELVNIVVHDEPEDYYELPDEVLSSPESGLSSEVLQRLKEENTFIPKEGVCLGRCPVCLEDMSGDGETQLLPLPCHHIFHQFCISTWLKKKISCPLCHSEITTANMH